MIKARKHTDLLQDPLKLYQQGLDVDHILKQRGGRRRRAAVADAAASALRRRLRAGPL